MEKIKIFIIEDDKSLVKIISGALDKEKFEVSLALPTEESLKRIVEEQPALIILDILLPGESGFDFLQTLKNTRETQFIPVLILSNLGQNEEIKRGLEMGAADYLVKADLSIQDIVNKIVATINK